jgi:hypothetical protein
MESKKSELRDRLLGQQVNNAETRARYQREVDAMLEQIRREDRWMGLAHAAVVVLLATALLFGAAILVYFTFQAIRYPDWIGLLLLALGWSVFFLAALALLWHFNRRIRTNELLVQVKALEMRLSQLEESRGGA